MRFIIQFSFLFLVSTNSYLLTEEQRNQKIQIYSPSFNSDRILSFEQLTDEIKSKQLIYIGEKHDNPTHHNIQLDIIKSLYNQNNKIAIGMEMFQAKYQAYINDYIFGNISEEEFLSKTEYEKRWGYDFDLYRSIIDFAKNNRIPIIALNIESEIIKKISKKGISNLQADDLNKLPQSIDFTNIDYRKFLYEIFKEHPNYKEKTFERFNSAQLVWDEFMAERVNNFLKHNKDYQMVVLAGNGHLIYSYGIPSRVYKRNNKHYTVISNGVELKPQIADYVINPLNE